MRTPGLLEAADALLADASQRDPWLAELLVAGIGWATVELERAADEVAAAVVQDGMPEPRWAPGPRDPLLGATTWISHAPSGAGERLSPSLVLLEPDTEGRLAATLARFGEGVAAAYVGRRADGGAVTPDPVRLGRREEGPLGPARLVLSRPAWGPNVVVLDRLASRSTGARP